MLTERLVGVKQVLLPAGVGFELGYPECLYHKGLVALPDGGVGESLSYSTAKKLLAPDGSPAKARAPFKGSASLDFGRVAHGMVTGVGAVVEVLPTTGWLTSKGELAANGAATVGYKAAKAEIEARGLTPVSETDWADIQAMQEAILANSEAADLLTSEGHPEVSLFGVDEPTGTYLRGRADYWSIQAGALIDYKTTVKVPSAHNLERAIWDYHYELQAAWYLELAGQVGIRVDRFVFVFQEKTPPFSVVVAPLAASAVEKGRDEMRQVIDLWADCVASGVWPGPPNLVEVGLPAWVAGRQAATGAVPQGAGLVDDDLAAELAAWAEGPCPLPRNLED
ncbi:MAG: PD-(D/E)XK nuclease-like domain-containing protein [Propionibacteriaceae bacterium]|jgi:hypothetical protein|nr:PD-(D/E)XK nuclease-like domain-containing protein [Propionibacteriaceae bacterium]